MREIKFRAWNKVEKTFHKFDLSMIYGYEGEVCGVLMPGGEVLNYNSGYGRNGLNEDLEIMQYTGLKDKNQKQIYEGDIVKWQYTNGEFEISEVFWSDSGVCFTTLQDLLSTAHEVVGNIYENPDLLDKQS